MRSFSTTDTVNYAQSPFPAHRLGPLRACSVTLPAGVRLSRSSPILTGTGSCSSSYQSLVTAWAVTWICAAPPAAPVRMSVPPASSRDPSSPSNELNGHTLRKILNLEPIPSRKSAFCSTWIDEMELTCLSLHLHTRPPPGPSSLSNQETRKSQPI